jgi:hypothetical protein
METEREIIGESKIEKELIALLESKGFTTRKSENSDKPSNGVYHYECEDLVYHVSINRRSYTVTDHSNKQCLYSFDGELYDEDDNYLGLASIEQLLFAIEETPDFYLYYVQPEPYTCWKSSRSLRPDGTVKKISRSVITFSK